MGLNDSGLEPVDYYCVVKLDPIEEKVGSIILPDTNKERSQMATTQATLLAVGGNAFKDWDGTKPSPGNRIVIQKYAGVFKEADPTDLYRIVTDKDILAIVQT